MEIPFQIKDSLLTGVLTHLETFSGAESVFMIRAGYRADALVIPDQVLVFTKHDGTPLEISVLSATTDGHFILGPDGASDFAVCFGLD